MSTTTGLAFIGGLGTGEVLFILLILLLLFGAAKIPELARSLGKAQREFQHARDEVEKEVTRPPAAPTREALAPSYSGAPAQPVADDSEEARLQREARALGIPVEGKSLEQLRDEVASRQASHPPKE